MLYNFLFPIKKNCYHFSHCYQYYRKVLNDMLTQIYCLPLSTQILPAYNAVSFY